MKRLIYLTLAITPLTSFASQLNSSDCDIVANALLGDKAAIEKTVQSFKEEYVYFAFEVMMDIHKDALPEHLDKKRMALLYDQVRTLNYNLKDVGFPLAANFCVQDKTTSFSQIARASYLGNIDMLKAPSE